VGFAVIGQRYTVIEIDTEAGQIRVTPDPVETTGSYNGWVVRENLLAQGVVAPYSISPNFLVDLNAGDGFVTFGSGTSWNNVALLQFGDTISIDGTTHLVLRFDPGTRRAYITPNVSLTSTGFQVYVTLRPGRPTTPISTDFLDRLPSDSLQLDLISSLSTGDDASTTATSDTVDLTVETFSNLGAIPGDYLLILEGPDSLVDVGDGPGVFMIAEITGGGNTCRLIEELTNTGNVRYGIRRRVS
jgi:hypothetical protein